MKSPNEDRFLSILEQSPLSIQILSPEGYTLQVNKAWEQLWGVTLDQIRDYNMLEDEQLVRRGVMPFIKRAFAGEACEIPPILYDPEETIPGKTRHEQPKRWTKGIIYPIKDAEGRVVEVVLMHEDITTQVEAEEKVRASEARYRELLENANDIIYSHDLAGNYLSINAAGEKITGYTREEVLCGGMNMAQIVVPEHLELARAMTKRKLQDPASTTVYEVDIFAKDGRRLTLEVNTRISYREGVPVAVEGVARDVTERKRIEREKSELAAQIEKQRKHLQAMVSSIPGVVWEAWGEPDARGQRINFVSDYVETMLGYTVEEWLSTPNFWLNIVHPDDKETAARTALETFALPDGQRGTNQFRWMTKDGRAIWVESQSVPIYDEAGKPVGMRGVTMDVSERKQKEAREHFLAEASTTLASSLEYETTLATIAQLAVPHFADWCAVDLADDGEGGTLHRLAVAHVDPEKIAWAHEMYRLYPPDPVEPQGLYEVFRTGRSEFYPDIPEELLEQSARDAAHMEIIRQVGFRSAMLVPLKAREKILGVMTFVNTDESNRRHTREDLALAEDLANRAALAVENARLYRSERQTRQVAERTSDLLKRLQAVSTSLSQALTPEQVATAVIEQGVNSLGAHAGTVVRLDDAAGELEIVGTVNFPKQITDKWRRFSLDQNVPIADAVRTKAPVIVESIEEWSRQYPAIGPLASVTGSRALIALPLIFEGRIIGAMGLSFLEPQKFTPDDYAFMLALAHQCAQALERSRLYENERQLRAQAEAANRMKDEFLATVSHELRTPLNAIVGWSSMLMTNKLDEGTAFRAIQTIERNAKTQAQIIEDLLDVSRIITGKLKLELSPTELVPVIETALESLRPTAEAKSIDLRFGPDAEAAAADMVLGDADRLQQVMWNLLSNAIKFTPENGLVEVSLARVDSQARITVSDTGQGIPPEFLPFVFERFSQADGTTTRKYGGLGLGLAIVRHLVEMHGGSVNVESAGRDRGTTFTVSLPLVKTRPARPESAAADESTGPAEGADVIFFSEPGSLAERFSRLRDLRVLVVDDEPDTRLLLTTVLETCGASVVSAGSAGEAFEAFRDFRPHLLVSDIAMPGEDGYSLIRRVREHVAAEGAEVVPAVALTAYARTEDREKALEAGYQKHLSKPIVPEDFLSALQELV